MDKILKELGKYYISAMIMFDAFFVMLMLLPNKVSVVYYIVGIILNTLFVVLAKDYTDNPQSAMTWVKINVIFLMISVLDRLNASIESILIVQIPGFIKLIISGMFLIIVIVSMIVYGNEINVINSKIRVKDTINMISGNEQLSDAQIQNSDVILCKDKETGLPVVWDGLSRFLHMLILGATGTGKTSQILIPLIEQDVKYNRGVMVFEPKGDLAEKVYALGKIYKRTDCLFFDPIAPDCPYYNVFDGDESEVTETVITTFLAMGTTSGTPYWDNMTDNLLRKAIMVIKRIEKAYTDPDTGISERPATIVTLNELINNTDNRGRNMVQELSNIPTLNEMEAKQNIDTKDWFLNDYFSQNSHTYRDTSNIRAQVSKLCQNEYLLRILNPPTGKSDINFDKILEQGQCVSITISQGVLGELGITLGYFMILNMERAIFRRKGTEDTRKHCFIYVDEFQMFSNKDFVKLLEQGRSYRTALTLATQSRHGIKIGAGKDGDAFLYSVDTNTRNTVLLPDLHPEDAKFFEDKYGKELVIKERFSERTSSIFERITNGFAGDRRSWEEVEESRMSASDIRYKPFKEITYQLIDANNSVEFARVGKANFIDKNLNRIIKGIVYEYQEDQENKRKAIKEEREKVMNEKYRAFQATRSGSGRKFGANQKVTLSGIIDSQGSAGSNKVQPIQNLWSEEPTEQMPIKQGQPNTPLNLVFSDDDDDFE